VLRKSERTFDKTVRDVGVHAKVAVFSMNHSYQAAYCWRRTSAFSHRKHILDFREQGGIVIDVDHAYNNLCSALMHTV